MDFVQMMIGGVIIPVWASRRKVKMPGGYCTSEVHNLCKDGKYICMLMYPQTGQRVKLGACDTLQEAKMKAFA